MGNKGLALGLALLCLFAVGFVPTDAAATAHHLVGGLAGDTVFEVRRNGILLFQATSSSAGVLEFDAPGTGSLHLLALGVQPDVTPPSAISDLEVAGAASSSITLEWTSPGDDGQVGRAATYDLRYSTTPITAGSFASATQAAGEPAPKTSGQLESMTVGGLSSGVTYYFALKTADERSNWSGLSNVVNGVTVVTGDTTPPSNVSTLAVSATTATSATLSWTSVGDDGGAGKATTYDVRYSLSTITSASWSSATQATGEPAPKTSGQSETFLISGLQSNKTYYFAAKVADEVPNWSGLSNVASGATPPAPDTSPPSAVTTLATGTATSNSIALAWTSVGDDGQSGTAAAYDLRYSTASITSANWSSATQWPSEPTPKPSGQLEIVTITGLAANTRYYFALKTRDEASNWSALSNVVNKLTLAPPDQSPPSAVTTLQVTSTAVTSATLTWTAVGDDGNSGRAASYDMRYSTAPITAANWGSALRANSEPSPKLPGQTETFVVGGLSPQTTYHFALKVGDEIPNWSALSNVPQGTTGAGSDTSPPSAVSNLALPDGDATRIFVTWTTSGDDGQSGVAHHFDLRRSLSPITSANFIHATEVAGEPTPGPGSTFHEMWVEGLETATRYYFAIRVVDEASNQSPVSNVAWRETLSEPDNFGPVRIDDLALEGGTGLPLLAWSAPHDSLHDETAVAAYEVHLHDAPIPTSGAGILVFDGPAPAAPGTLERFQLTGLDWETTYYARVRSHDASGNWSRFSNQVNFTTPPEPVDADVIPPAAIDDLAFVAAGPNWIDLTWQATGDDGAEGAATTYDLRYATFPVTSLTWQSATPAAGEPAPAASGATQTLRVGNLGVDVLHYFAILATDEIGNASLLSNVAQGRTVRPLDTAPPRRVLDLEAAEITTNSLVLSWTTPADSLSPFSVGSSQVAGYDLRFRLGTLDGSTWNSATGLTAPFPGEPDTPAHISVLGLLPETTYAFALESADSRGNRSTLSNVALVTTLPLEDDPPPPPADTLAPSAPGALAFEGQGSHEGRLTWNAPGDDGANGQASAYRLRVFTSEDENALLGPLEWSDGDSIALDLLPGVAGAAQTLELEDLAPGVHRAYALRAIDDSGNWGPFGVTAPVALPWPADDVPPEPVADLRAELHGVTASENAHFHAEPAGPTGDEPPAEVIRYDVHLSWTAPPDPRPERDATAVTQYRLLRSSWAGGAMASIDWSGDVWDTVFVATAIPGDPESLTVRALAPGHHFAFALHAIDLPGNVSDLSNEAFVTTPADTSDSPDPEDPDTTAPAAIEDLDGYALSSGGLRLLWTAVGDDDSTGRATRYEGRWSLSPFVERDWTALDTLPGLPAPDSVGVLQTCEWPDLLPGTTYHVSLRARDEAGNLSPFGSVLALTTSEEQDLSPPSPPSAVGVSWEDPFVLLDWAPSASADVVGYDVYRRSDLGGVLALHQEGWTESALSDSVVERGRTYYYALRARDAAGNQSPLTAEVSVLIPVLTPVDPNGPDLLIDQLRADPVDARAGHVTVRWSVRNRGDLEGFHVWRETLPADPLIGGKVTRANGLPAGIVQTLDDGRDGTDNTPHPEYTIQLSETMLAGPGPHAYDDAPLPPPGAYLYWIEAIGTTSGTRFLEPLLVVVPEFTGGLLGLFPNPTPGDLRIVYALSTPGTVRLQMYDATGRAIGDVREQLGARGRQEWALDVRGLASGSLSAGIYYLRLDTGSSREVARIVLLDSAP